MHNRRYYKSIESIKMKRRKSRFCVILPKYRIKGLRVKNRRRIGVSVALAGRSDVGSDIDLPKAVRLAI